MDKIEKEMLETNPIHFFINKGEVEEAEYLFSLYGENHPTYNYKKLNRGVLKECLLNNQYDLFTRILKSMNNIPECDWNIIYFQDVKTHPEIAKELVEKGLKVYKYEYSFRMMEKEYPDIAKLF